MTTYRPPLGTVEHQSGPVTWSGDSTDPWIQVQRGGLWRITAMLTGVVADIVQATAYRYANSDGSMHVIAQTEWMDNPFTAVLVADYFLEENDTVRLQLDDVSGTSAPEWLFSHFTVTEVGSCSDASIADATPPPVEGPPIG